MRNALTWSLVVVGCLHAPALAQTDLERFDRQLEQIYRQTRQRADESVPTEARALFDYGAFITFNFVAIDDPNQKTHILRQTDFNAYARLNIDNVHEFFVRGRTSYRDWNSGDDFDGHGDDWVEPTLDRGWYKFDFGRYMAAYQGEQVATTFSIKAGRQLVHWVNGLTLSRQLDGGVITVGHDPLTLEVVLGRTRPSTTDIDSSRPGFDGDTLRHFYGAKLAWQAHPRHTPFLYGLVQQDHNDQDFNPDPLRFARLDNPGLPVLPTEYEYDSWYVGAGSTGSLNDEILYAVEIVYQGGQGLSNSFNEFGLPIDQTREDIQAWALDVRLEYLFDDDNNTRASVELLLASGDDDRQHTTNTFGGNRSGTDDRAFNGFGFVNTGLAFAPDVSNLVMVRGGVATFPLPTVDLFRRFQIGTDLFVFGKLDSDAPIDEPTSNDFYLGFEADVYVNWQITSDLSLAVRYGVFFPGEAIETDNDARHFFYTGVTIGF